MKNKVRHIIEQVAGDHGKNYCLEKENDRSWGDAGVSQEQLGKAAGPGDSGGSAGRWGEPREWS